MTARKSARFLEENADLVKDLDRLDSATVQPVKSHQGMGLAGAAQPAEGSAEDPA